MKELNKIQQGLHAPKGQKNTFGNYKYRSCEDILEAVKPLLGESILTLTDEMVEIGDRIYVKATATLKGNDTIETVSAYARESETKKGMDDSQITGSASSYARKYALNGLFCIDDTKDADTMDNTKHETMVKEPMNISPHGEDTTQTYLDDAERKINECHTMEQLKACKVQLKPTYDYLKDKVKDKVKDETALQAFKELVADKQEQLKGE